MAALSSSEFTKGVLVGAGAAIAAGIAYYFGLHPAAPKEHKKVFVLAVRMKLDKSKGGLQAFKEAFTSLAQYCKNSEPNTLSYELCAGEEDENEILIYERYIQKEDLSFITSRTSQEQQYSSSTAVITSHRL
jgi:quinol monooxygenase YgiN